MQCSGHGTVTLSRSTPCTSPVVDLANETLQVESQQLLALSGNLNTNVTFTGLRGGVGGQGLFTTTVSGRGQVALLSAGGPRSPSRCRRSTRWWSIPTRSSRRAGR